jgi:hypothetical protein
MQLLNELADVDGCGVAIFISVGMPSGCLPNHFDLFGTLTWFFS